MHRLQTGDIVVVKDPDCILSNIGLFHDNVYVVEKIRNLKYRGRDVLYAKLDGSPNLVLLDFLEYIKSREHFEDEGLFEL